MVCLGVKSRAVGRKVQMNPLSYGGIQLTDVIYFLGEN